MIEGWTQNDPEYPSGVILIWTNPISELPNGWVICDGNNGTPDLIDRYVKSIPDAATDPGSVGGTNSTILDSSHLPSHNHSASMSSSGDHRHKVPNHEVDNAGVQYRTGPMDYDPDKTSESVDSTSVDHNHSITTDPTGGGSSIDNRPVSYEAIYIQKL